MDDAKPGVVAETWMETEASVIKSLLESYEIPCHYTSGLPRGVYPLKVVPSRAIRIYVPAALAEEARRILAAHRRIHNHLRLVDDDALEEKKA